MYKKILIIEDDKRRIEQFKENFTHVEMQFAKTVKDSIRLLKKNDYDMIFFDHDLGNGGDSIDVVKWMIVNMKKIPKNIYVHSANPVGANNIIRYFKLAKRAPMIWKKEINFGRL